ncbi:serine hydrolase domain-containing protein [Shewanella psychrotolerans]|uniref:serine hydrolase domain-containing protein n=1 Tax=Shewanella psychrotolerans TaxID=2864206 RepID=UPI001C6609AF|nr:serine hydrolase domain-containing protein [Shewanella psychrotolerans]QYJ99769.1 beta-lactamase family protein [Shewanella psychrotolerans]
MFLKTVISSLAVFCSSAAIYSSCVDASQYHTVSDDFKQQFQKRLKKNKVPGGAFVIVEGDKIVNLGTFGKRHKGGDEKINADTVFRLASVSKTFAGTLASLLVHEHKLSWQQPITTYLPAFSLAPPAKSTEITLGHVIGQSTGLMPNSYDNLINANIKFDDILPKFADLTPMCDPGVCYSYQNVAFSFIEQAIEQQSGQRYEQVINQRLFEPLDMKTASVGFDAFNQVSNRAEPHIKTRFGFKQVKVKPNYYQLLPAAGVNASITDISKWLIANMGHRQDVISSRVIEDVTTPGVRTTKELRRREWKAYLDDAHYGKGWRVYDFQGHPLIYHAGWVAGYVTEIAYSPELNVGMAMLLNGESRVIAELGAYFWHDLFSHAKQNSKIVAKGMGKD